MSIEALSDLDKPIKIEDAIEVEIAQKELTTLGESLAEEIRNLPSAPRISIIISTFVDPNLDYNNQQNILDEISKKRLLLLEVLSKAEILNQEDTIKLSEIITNFDFAPLPTNPNEFISLIDSLIIKIINTSEIPYISKNKFFQKLKGKCEELHQANALSGIISDTETPQVSINTPLPLNINYISNPDVVETRNSKLRLIKEKIQIRSSMLFQFSAAEKIEAIHGDTLVPEEEETYLQDKFYRENISEFIDNTVPEKVDQGYPLELIEILKGNVPNVTYRQLNTAKIQLLRIYREYINTILTDDILNQRVVDEQNDSSLTQIRIGQDNVESAVTRRIKTRRMELFSSLHLGTVAANKVNPHLPKENLVPISDNLLNFIGGKKLPESSTTDLLAEFNPEQIKKLNAIKEFASIEFNEANDGIPSAIFSRFLEKLGIATEETLKVEQIELSDKKSANTKFSTYTVKVLNNGTIAVDHKYRTLLIPKSWKPKLSSILKSLQHEAGHIAQQLSRDQSILPGAKKLSGFGRSDTLAEAGAIKSEALMTNLMGGEREINTYHVDILKGIIEGKNYWEIINVVLKILSERNIRNGENKKIEDLVKTAIKTVNRAYASLGAMANKNDLNGRYPTYAGFLSYTYQGLPEFSSQPFYVSGIPAHRTDLQEFMPQPYINGKAISESLICKAAIEAAYEVLIEKNIIKVES